MIKIVMLHLTLDTRNVMVLLTMPLALCGVGANDVT